MQDNAYLGKNNPKHQYTMNNMLVNSSTEQNIVGVLVTGNLKTIKPPCIGCPEGELSLMPNDKMSLPFQGSFHPLYQTRSHLEFASCVRNP